MRNDRETLAFLGLLSEPTRAPFGAKNLLLALNLQYRLWLDKEIRSAESFGKKKAQHRTHIHTWDDFKIELFIKY